MEQHYEQYTQEDQEVWKLLFQRQREVLEGRASKIYLDCLERIGFTADRIPYFPELDEKLLERTGWSIEVVPGLIDQPRFFELLSKRRFPSSTWLRSKENLDYLQEPDMFHDLFGHAPLLAHPPFANFFQEMGELALDHIEDEKAIALIGALYWFTIEFGVIEEDDGLRLYGAGLCSSPGEAVHALSDEPELWAFDPVKAMDTDYRIDRYQERYFVIQDFEELEKSLDRVKANLERPQKGVDA
jgi:phenylalanine-4-hydroxylase